MVCHCQHAYAVIVRKQGDLLLNGKRHYSHVDVRDWGDIGWHLSYTLDEARIGDLDYANITDVTRGCKFWRTGTISALGHYLIIHLWQSQQWLKISRQKGRLL